MARPLTYFVRRGRRFHKLVVVHPTTLRGSLAWICRCDCGRLSRPIDNAALAKGRVRSCGCLKPMGRLSHGEARHGKVTPEYRAWRAMKNRCLNPNAEAYEAYGGRGIKICKRWQNSFQAFLADVGRRPSKHHSLDRINNNLKRGYFRSNVRWATKRQQARNRRRGKRV